MIIIPLQTVIPEELRFGVLHGALDRAWGFRGVAAGSLLFDCGTSPPRWD